MFFDNLSIKHYTGPLLEETHYYPFGLTMAGISSKALKPNYVENKKNKFQNQEFNNDLAVDIYEFKYRMDDPQIGRFWQIDPLANKYVYNSTYAFSENKVTRHVELEGLEAVLWEEDTYNNCSPCYTVLPQNAPQPPSKEKAVDKKNDDKAKEKKGDEKKEQKTDKGFHWAGRTTTTKVNEQESGIDWVTGDKSTVTNYTAKVEGQGGLFMSNTTFDKQGHFDDASVSVGPLSVGVTKDGVIFGGANIGGTDIHIGSGLGVGAGQLIVGSSHTTKNGDQTGVEANNKPGVVTVLAVVAAIISIPALAL